MDWHLQQVFVPTMHALFGLKGQQLTAARIAHSRQQLLPLACFQIKLKLGADSPNDRLWNIACWQCPLGIRKGTSREAVGLVGIFIAE
jgi:hypothetical protein